MISKDVCQRVLQAAVSTGADYAEVFAEHTDERAISMLDSKVNAIRSSVIAGAAVRVYKGLRSVMATTIDTSEAGLIRCARQAGAEVILEIVPGRTDPLLPVRELLFQGTILPGQAKSVLKTWRADSAYQACLHAAEQVQELIEQDAPYALVLKKMLQALANHVNVLQSIVGHFR